MRGVIKLLGRQFFVIYITKLSERTIAGCWQNSKTLLFKSFSTACLLQAPLGRLQMENNSLGDFLYISNRVWMSTPSKRLRVRVQIRIVLHSHPSLHCIPTSPPT